MHSPLLCSATQMKGIWQEDYACCCFIGAASGLLPESLYLLLGLIYHLLFSPIFLQGCNISWDRFTFSGTQQYSLRCHFLASSYSNILRRSEGNLDLIILVLICDIWLQDINFMYALPNKN